MVVSAFIQSTKALLAKFGVDAPDIRIEGLTLDSREVNTRLAFLAIKGHERDGRDFIPQAISLGARVILAQTDDSEAHGQMEMRDHSVIISLYELPQMLSALAAAFYDYPAQKMTTVAVTGTNGKTSTVQLLTQLKDALGTRSASIGTLGSSVFEGDATQWSNTPAANTTPDAIRMQYLLADFVQSEVRHTAFEASSHALVQGRLGTVKTDIAVFTNLTRDHLDYHGTMEEYGKAKRLLLCQPGLKAVVLNANDDESNKWDNVADNAISRIWTGIDESADGALFRAHNNPQSRHCFATNASYHSGGCSFELVSSWGSAAISLPLFGKFNISNVLSAIGTLLAEGERFDAVVKAVNAITPVPGRMEVFPVPGAANLVVDYAHTPDALEKVLLSAKFHTAGKVWCVFGCGGDRDTGKRPLMGQAAEAGADAIVITTDNSRSEDPESIAQDIITGLKDSSLAVSIPDREQAIRHCLAHADKSDIIIVAGKGHEDYQIIGDKKTNYNERAVVARLQQEYSK
ncbi:UDP-N-acetylmuramoyl-L-alanyl-D-glutamate--2,6-diaminopimelate ligase [Alteromonas mediterranea]|uniref:UDP-N-acetylmuramoyl-L-alanyl-D-glutamate--2, 6-diaminopimelate ligase n=1 Tax=Alteromonas mediterranea TaxID=314275 RepID=UPI0003557536|nr:UDP-N-acetylmuramoyl-L-alanyl-D-glutamate--2,6-diaminopimelate ligase [Alteromonas mediterranea]AGP86670.1 UDP-N-acetylmuramoylalanyl-D-glutamate--2,6-diaminopimelate ligase [Alteromonas mediterranea U4]AGP90791.1 UDP-N-acetylmuramoylalanyl-D-glutamate--2,6-diaminopimelate ligase [Alteromonas mediterranea U7]AGP94628.1 UDP-N-acetylmuramoylalanyl-D-glutamate--2,6-diaminopimelate ligase [Alteromonas mediterranea U8]MEA3380024.1 UDP-N-acetylmuramoyl-L-alanyl-D-glutamate--2,6-diaminopimelate lig